MGKHYTKPRVKRQAEEAQKKIAVVPEVAKNSTTLSQRDDDGGHAQKKSKQKRAKNPPRNRYVAPKKSSHKGKTPLLSSGWTQNIVVAAIIGCIAPVFGMVVKEPKAIIVGAALGLTIIIWVIAVLMLNSPSIITKSADATSQDVKHGLVTERPTIEKQLKLQSQIAQARQWRPPELPKEAIDSKGKAMVHLKLGGVIWDWPAGPEEFEQTNTAFAIGLPGGRVVIPYIKDKSVYVKTQTMFGTKEETIHLNNESLTTIPPGWDRNFNSNSFEIVDETMLPVLQVRYNAADSIEVYGLFVAPSGAITIAFGHSTSGSQAGIPLDPIPDRKAWFKYPSTKYLTNWPNNRRKLTRMENNA